MDSQAVRSGGANSVQAAGIPFFPLTEAAHGQPADVFGLASYNPGLMVFFKKI